MGKLNVDIDEELELKFRHLVLQNYGSKEDAISRAVNEAIAKWVEVNSDEPIARAIWNAYGKSEGASMMKISRMTGIDYDKVREIVPRLQYLDLLDTWFSGHRAIGNFETQYLD